MDTAIVKDLLALVHDLLLRPHLHRRQGFDVGAVIAKAGCYLLVESINEVLQAAAEGAECPLLEYVGAILVGSRRLVRVAILPEIRVQTGVQQLF